MANPKDDLADFGRWLEEEHCHTKNTTYTMRSNVRRVIREVDPISTETPDVFFGTLKQAGPAKDGGGSEEVSEALTLL